MRPALECVEAEDKDFARALQAYHGVLSSYWDRARTSLSVSEDGDQPQAASRPVAPSL